MWAIARAKKMMDPQDYNRIVEQKMKQEGLTRQQALDEYNVFLENPSFYYALDKKKNTKNRWVTKKFWRHDRQSRGASLTTLSNRK